MSQSTKRLKTQTATSKTSTRATAASKPALIVGVGASAGGVDAFIELLSYLPDDTGLAFVFLLHLNPAHKSQLTGILARATRMPVLEAKNGTSLKADNVYVLPPNTVMTMRRGRLKLAPPTESKRTSIDIFFQSLAEDQKSRAVGIILSGMASDGTIGLEEIKAAGGITCVQDERSSGYSGMPHSAIAAGCADFVLPPKGIAAELVRLGRHPLIKAAAEAEDAQFADASALGSIFTLLRTASGVDFSLYKPSTMRRRISRRMYLLDISRLKDYLDHLKAKPAEIQALYNDLLICVTSFFRDPKVFEALKRKIFPHIVKGHDLNSPVRIWVAGCASGEEAYSIAITYLEFLRKSDVSVPAHIFATDISDTATAKARKGHYPESIASCMSPELLGRYFVRSGQGYQVGKQLRDMCTFAHHDVTADPPFASQDMISCRNLLIYLEPPLQKTVLATFHYALQPSGYLVLGSAETVGNSSDLFAEEDKHLKFYSKKAGRASHLRLVTGRIAEAKSLAAAAPAAPHASRPPQTDALAVADRLALRRFAPAGVVVNRDLDILQFRGDTSRYLKTSPGKASLNLLRMVPEDLSIDLQLLIKKAFKTQAPVQKHNLWVRLNRRSRLISLEAVAFDAPPAIERYCLVSFLTPPPSVAAAEARPAKEPRNSLFQKLKRELVETKAYLQSRIEESESRNAALTVANEEVISSNEELQSTNEEFESSREELQTANEELNTLNDELRKQNATLVQLGGDLDNILGSLNIPIALLGLDLRIRRVTLMEDTPLELTPADVGRSILDIQKKLGIPDLEEMALEVIKTCRYKEFEVSGKDGRWYKLRVRPYRSARDKIEGVVLALLDADVAKRALLQLQDVMDQSLVILDSGLRVQSANPRFYDYFRLSPKLTQGRLLRELAGGQWNNAALNALLNDTLVNGTPFRGFELDRSYKHLGQRLLRLSAVRVPNEGRAAHTLFLTIDDITDLRRAETVKKMAERERIQREFIANVSHELRTPVTAIKGFAQTLKHGGLDDRRHRMGFVDTIERNADRLARLIEDLLNITKLTERPTPRLRKVRLSALIGECISDLAPRAKASRISIHGKIPAALEVSADRAQIVDVLQNLLTNALKFNRPGGKVWIKAHAAENEAVIVVQDTGIGIPKRDLPHLFERFYRGRNARTRPGAGLGLSIAQQIIIAHGGQICADSRRGHGACVHFTLPLWKTRAPLTRLRGRNPTARSAEAAPRRRPGR